MNEHSEEPAGHGRGEPPRATTRERLRVGARRPRALRPPARDEEQTLVLTVCILVMTLVALTVVNLLL